VKTTPPQRRVMAIDPGKVRIGLAISDALGISLTPLGVVQGGEGAKERILEVVKREVPGAIVVGYPVNMDGSKGKQAAASKALAESLAKELPGVSVYLWDERLTSYEATRILEAADRTPSRDKSQIDVMSAKIILRSFLDAERAGETLKPVDLSQNGSPKT